MIGKVLVAAICLSAVGTPAAAQDTRNAELAFGDKRLNSTYTTLIRQLAPSDQDRLRTAQRAWIQFRNADCAFGWPDPRDCLIQRTDEREKQLRDSVYFDRSGKLIKLLDPR